MPRTRQQMKQETIAVAPAMLVAKRAASEGLDAEPRRKRTAFGDITNAIQSVVIDSTKRIKAAATKKPTVVATGVKPAKRNSAVGDALSCVHGVPPVLASVDEDIDSNDSYDQGLAPELMQEDESANFTELRPTSAAAPGGGSASSSSSNNSADSQKRAGSPSSLKLNEPSITNNNTVSGKLDTNDLSDYDRENIRDPFNVPHYASDIFNYYRRREVLFAVGDYMANKKQPHISKEMRAILVDWMVEIQENFELNHETLYQAVKMLDLYLDRAIVGKEDLQLVGATALFISSKFDERQPPCLDDFLYICDDAYTRELLLHMEMQMLVTLQFDIGMPLSYRYIRRYAKATKADMRTLTLGRYILERSLMYYDFVVDRESELAAGALLLALRMIQKEVNADDSSAVPWTSNHALYSGVSSERAELMLTRLNRILTVEPPAKSLTSVKTKYAHSVFFEVALIKPLGETGCTAA